MPMTDSLNIKISQVAEGVIVTLVGNASMELCDRLGASLQEACQKRPKLLALDLARLEFICSLGLGAIVVAYLRVNKYGGKVVLASPIDAVREMLTTTKLGTLLPVTDTVEDALAIV